MTSLHTHAPTVTVWRPPKAVWAVAFACVVAFMGIGNVDPILPAIAVNLNAGPSQVELLFTSYFAVTGAMLLLVGVASSRFGPRRTLLIGLGLVVVFAGLLGTSGSVGEIVGFRGGWGLGNALFVGTALAVIVGSASGLGISVEPLVGARSVASPGAGRSSSPPPSWPSASCSSPPCSDRARARSSGSASATPSARCVTSAC